MGRGWAEVIVPTIFLLSVGGAAVIIWQAKAHGVPIFYVLGLGMMALGIGFSALHLSVSDEYLRQHFGGERNPDAADVARGLGRIADRDCNDHIPVLLGRRPVT